MKTLTSAPRRWQVGVGLLLLAALAVRLGFSLSMGNRYYFADTAEYERFALRILAGLGPDPAAPRAPLYPAFMALGFLLGGGGNYVMVRLLQALLSTGIVAITAALATHLGGRGAGLLAMVLMAFGPLYVFTSGMLYPTTLYSLLLVTAVAGAVVLVDRPGHLLGFELGLAMGLGWLTEHVMLAPLVALGLWLVWQTPRAGGRFVTALLFAAVGFAVIVVPYALEQRQVYGSRTVFMQKAQYVLHWARTDSSMAGGRRVRLPAGATYEALGAGAFARRELDLVRTQPAAYAADVVAEFLHFFKPIPDRIQTKNQYNRPEILLVAAVHFVPVLVFAIAGVLAGRTARRSRALLALVVLATAGFYSLFFAQTRYRIPVEPLLVVLASLGFVRFFPRISALLGGEPAPTPPPGPRATAPGPVPQRPA